MDVPKLSIVLAVTLLAACQSREEPTRLSLPVGAVDVQEVQLLGGKAHETLFTMQVRFPANPALKHYSKEIKGPWVRCNWVPEWQSFVDGTEVPNKTVHQQMYVWINRPAKRMLTLSSRYYSSEHCPGEPENEVQQVILVEYLDANIDDTISHLKLECPTMRSDKSTQPTPKGEAGFKRYA